MAGWLTLHVCACDLVHYMNFQCSLSIVQWHRMANISGHKKWRLSSIKPPISMFYHVVFVPVDKKNYNPSFDYIINHKFFLFFFRFRRKKHWNVLRALFESDRMTHYIKFGINWDFFVHLLSLPLEKYRLTLDARKKIRYLDIFHPFRGLSFCK